ncbi:hypothetical protein SASPL_123585 [Salvia splendens]|uniref:Uncharacterized protein n=1 Tax=Salvia splendens TaxID=180675 RepID=A0A8X8XRF9_SALSN|nr:hypothetical protein SASPL_123585 [Salvia splendens]
MALVADNSGIGSLHAHDEKEPTHAIAATSGMRTIAIKSGVLAVLSDFYARVGWIHIRRLQAQGYSLRFKGRCGRLAVKAARRIHQDLGRIPHDIPRPLLSSIKDECPQTGDYRSQAGVR